MTSASTRIREARERAGLAASYVAECAGLNDNWYSDVEADDFEVINNISLHALAMIGRTVGLTPLQIVNGFEAEPPSEVIPLSALRAHAQMRMLSDGLSVEEFSTRVGWDLAPLLSDLDPIHKYTVQGLQDICRDIGVDWRAALSS